jgi:hypothetical protein
VIHRDYVPLGEVGFCILVCGDDSIVALCGTDDVVYFEGDASMFDQSISFGPLKLEYHILVECGVPEEITKMLYQVASNTFEVKPHVRDGDQSMFWLNREARPMRDTGGADTYVGNTIIMATAWFYVCCELSAGRWGDLKRDALNTITDLFSYLGFDMKLQMTANENRMTFLKGMWYPVQAPVVEGKEFGFKNIWGPLPSRILKMGKSLDDPRSMYHERDMLKAGAYFLSDVASSYSTFLQVPLVRAFVRRYREESERAQHRKTKLSYYSANSSGQFTHINLDDAALSCVCERYNVTREDILLTESLIESSSAFTFLSSPVFINAAHVDYS